MQVFILNIQRCVRASRFAASPIFLSICFDEGADELRELFMVLRDLQRVKFCVVSGCRFFQRGFRAASILLNIVIIIFLIYFLVNFTHAFFTLFLFLSYCIGVSSFFLDPLLFLAILFFRRYLRVWLDSPHVSHSFYKLFLFFFSC